MCSSAAGRIPWHHAVPNRAALHGHVGRSGHHHGQRRAREDTDHVGAILRSVPGVEYLGVVEAPPDLDYDCGPSITGLEPSRWTSIRAELWSALRATGADLVVTKSHACQREWCDLASDEVGVRCYISVVADALGCRGDYPSNMMRELKVLGEPEGLVQLTKGNWTSHGLSEREARDLVARYNWSGRVPDLPPP